MIDAAFTVAEPHNRDALKKPRGWILLIELLQIPNHTSGRITEREKRTGQTKAPIDLVLVRPLRDKAWKLLTKIGFEWNMRAF